MSTARKIISNTFSQVIGKIIVALLSVAIVKILASYFGKSRYGEYATIFEFLAFFGAIADMGIFTIAVREMSKQKDKEQEIFSEILSLRTFFTTLAMLAAVIVVFLIPKYEGTLIPYGVVLVAVSTWLVILSGTLSSILQVKMKMHFNAFSLVIGKIFATLAIIFIANFLHPFFSAKSFYQIVASSILGALITFLLTLFFASSFAEIKFSFQKERSLALLKEAVPFGLALILNTIYFRLDIILFSLLLPHSQNGICLEKFCGDSEAGSYAVAVRMLEVLIIIPLFFMNSVLPILTRYIQKKSKKIKKLLDHSFNFLFASGLSAAIGGMVLAREIVVLISSKDFLSNFSEKIFSSDLALQILMPAMFFTFLTTFFGFILIAFGKQKQLLWINLSAVLFNLITNLLVIKKWGLLGAGITSVLSEMLILILSFFALKKTINFTPNFQKLAKITTAALLMGIFTHFVFLIFKTIFIESIALFMVIILAVIFFIALLFALGIFNKEIINLLKRKNAS